MKLKLRLKKGVVPARSRLTITVDAHAPRLAFYTGFLSISN